MEEIVSKKADIEKDVLKRKDPQAFCILEMKAKAADVDNLLSCMKEKIKDTDYKRKIKILTLTPRAEKQLQNSSMVLSMLFKLQAN